MLHFVQILKKQIGICFFVTNLTFIKVDYGLWIRLIRKHQEEKNDTRTS